MPTRARTPGLARLAALMLPLMAMSPPAHAADPAPFDLPGPNLRINVTRGKTTLPIAQVPSLATGDELSIKADLPDDQTVRFILLSAFLHGATNPPPKAWIRAAETWKPKESDNSLSLTIPKGARQLVLFMVPDTGGAADAISGAVRGRPGEFVRATQDLNQASLDRSRLNAFMRAVRNEGSMHPQYLSTVAPTLAQSLSIKLNEQCLAKVVDLQALCLLENRESLVLGDVHSSSMAETIAGAPTDLALQISATREAGGGFYSPYIGVIRDVAHVFGAFSSPQFNYLPAISLLDGEESQLLLNAAPSFEKPKSVLVSAMPSIEDDQPPRLRSTADGPLCASRSDLVLPVAGAPLIFSTGYAREMVLNLTAADGKTASVPAQARADKGGYVMDQGDLMKTGLKGAVKARVQGYWGFKRFAGPEFALRFPADAQWQFIGTRPIADREGTVQLKGGAPGCIESVTLRSGGASRIVKYTGSEEAGIAFPVSADETRQGDLSVEVRQFGIAAPTTIAIPVERPEPTQPALALPPVQ